MKTLDKVLLGLAIFVIIFITVMCIFYALFQSVPDSLIYAVLGSGTSEAILTCIITCVKKKAGLKDNGTYY